MSSVPWGCQDQEGNQGAGGEQVREKKLKCCQSLWQHPPSCDHNSILLFHHQGPTLPTWPSCSGSGASSVLLHALLVALGEVRPNTDAMPSSGPRQTTPRAPLPQRKERCPNMQSSRPLICSALAVGPTVHRAYPMIDTGSRCSWPFFLSHRWSNASRQNLHQ